MRLWQNGAGVAKVGAAACLCLGLGLALASCSGGTGGNDPNPQVYKLGDRVPEGGGHYKVGKPYQIKGRWYYPKETDSYDAVGVASWYGEYFHGRKTANGEWYDMERLSAAHPTLPLPAYARVTNLENGRSIVVRVNDRGPYAHDREIDMSWAAAKELGFVRQGTAKVKVRYIATAPLEGDVPDMQYVDGGPAAGRPSLTASAPAPARRPLAETLLSDTPLPGREPRGRLQTTDLRPSGAATSPARAAPGPAQAVRADGAASGAATAGGGVRNILPKRFFVQAASFRDPERAGSLRDELAHLGVPDVLAVQAGTETFYRVRLGPFDDVGTALDVQTALAREGRRDARIIRE